MPSCLSLSLSLQPSGARPSRRPARPARTALAGRGRSWLGCSLGLDQRQQLSSHRIHREDILLGHDVLASFLPDRLLGSSLASRSASPPTRRRASPPTRRRASPPASRRATTDQPCIHRGQVGADLGERLVVVCLALSILSLFDQNMVLFRSFQDLQGFKEALPGRLVCISSL